jgi:hypothetical protein
VHIVDAHSVVAQQLLQLIPESCRSMMLLLSLDIARDGVDTVAADRERAETALPLKVRRVFVSNPVGCRMLELSDDGRGSGDRIEPAQQVDMIVVATYIDIGDAEVPSRGGKI